MLRQLHKEVQQSEIKGIEVVDDCLVNNDSMFDAVASNLEEAMAVISE